MTNFMSSFIIYIYRMPIPGPVGSGMLPAACEDPVKIFM